MIGIRQGRQARYVDGADLGSQVDALDQRQDAFYLRLEELSKRVKTLESASNAVITELDNQYGGNGGAKLTYGVNPREELQKYKFKKAYTDWTCFHCRTDISKGNVYIGGNNHRAYHTDCFIETILTFEDGDD